jgi:hypothetical protein
MRIFACLILIVAAATPLQGPVRLAMAGEPADGGLPPPTVPELSPLAVEVNTILARMGKKPGSRELEKQFLQVFERVYRREIGTDSAEDNSVYGAAFTKAHQLAGKGNGEILRALMLASLEPYGRSAEGGQTINEMLWENLEARPQLTVDTLAALPPATRQKIVETEYFHPVHDGFDFGTIDRELRMVRIPPGLESDVLKILLVISADLPEPPETPSEP